jgi:two-component system, NarL family, nitrate/nitrite response regulator NarL
MPMDILIIDDHPLTCQGLAALLSHSVAGARVRVGHSSADARQAMAAGVIPDWLFLDVHLPDDPDGRLFAELCTTPWVRRTVLISGAVPHELLRQALQAGVRGFIPKSADPALVLSGFDAIRRGVVFLPSDLKALALASPPADAPGKSLSPRQRDVEARMLRGVSNKAIAREFNISEHTVKEHVTAVLAHHGVGNRLALILKHQGGADKPEGSGL